MFCRYTSSTYEWNGKCVLVHHDEILNCSGFIVREFFNQSISVTHDVYAVKWRRRYSPIKTHHGYVSTTLLIVSRPHMTRSITHPSPSHPHTFYSLSNLTKRKTLQHPLFINNFYRIYKFHCLRERFHQNNKYLNLLKRSFQTLD